MDDAPGRAPARRAAAGRDPRGRRAGPRWTASTLPGVAAAGRGVRAGARRRLAAPGSPPVARRTTAFRERVAVHVRAAAPASRGRWRRRRSDPGEGWADRARRSSRGRPTLAGRPERGDPVERAAVAYLLRPEGWRERVPEAVVRVGRGGRWRRGRRRGRRPGPMRWPEALERPPSTPSTPGVRGTRTGWCGGCAASVADLEETRRRHRDQLAAVKAENAELRHRWATPGPGRARPRPRPRRAAQAAGRAGRRCGRQLGPEAETRRLRGAGRGARARTWPSLRRAERAGRGRGDAARPAAARHPAGAAQGLRRELALPAVDGSPADDVEALVAEHGTRASSGRGRVAPDDPALLDELLALPRVHLVVDGYNVTKTAWPDLPLERQRDRLLRGLAPLAARSGAEVTVVFDAAETQERPGGEPPRGRAGAVQPGRRHRRRRDPRAGRRRAPRAARGGRLQRPARWLATSYGRGPGRWRRPRWCGCWPAPERSGVAGRRRRWPAGTCVGTVGGSCRGSRPTRRRLPRRTPMSVHIDCDTCLVRGLACHDCVVTVLLGPTAGARVRRRRAPRARRAGRLGAGAAAADGVAARRARTWPVRDRTCDVCDRWSGRPAATPVVHDAPAGFAPASWPPTLVTQAPAQAGQTGSAQAPR